MTDKECWENFRKDMLENYNRKKKYALDFENSFIKKIEQLREKIPELKKLKIKKVKEFGTEHGFIEVKFSFDVEKLAINFNYAKREVDDSYIYIRINKKNLTKYRCCTEVKQVIDGYINNPSSFKEEFLNKNTKYFNY